MTDTDQLKRNNDIVSVIQNFIDLKPQGHDFVGLCPFHTENTPSFVVSEAKQLYCCHGCGAGGDVIEFIREHKFGAEEPKTGFIKAVEYLGGEIESEPVKYEPKQSKPEEPTKYEPLPYADAQNHYTGDVMQNMADFIFSKREDKPQLVKAWPYKDLDENGNLIVDLVAARLEDSKGKKSVLSFYYNGDTVKMKSYPILLFNRDRLKNEPEKDVLIVFGEKCAEIADECGFIGVTWNGGEKKVNKVDFEPLQGRSCWVWADDDEPGRKCLAEVVNAVPHVQTVEVFKELREAVPKGADIADALEYFGGSVDCVPEYVYKNSKRQPEPLKPEQRITEAEPEKPDHEKTFQILGIADDGQAYFITRSGLLMNFRTTSLNKTQLLNLAELNYWQTMYEDGKRTDWELAISDIIALSARVDFDPDRMRGRGAWRESDGRICYHDGATTQGEYSEDRIFLRRPVKDIGLNKEHPTRKERARIYQAASELTFATLADCIRILGWSVLAPFAGALPWRPSGLLTAASGSGKSTIINVLVKRLSKSKICSGGDTTAAGIRQNTGIDSCSVIIEEAEGDTPKKKQNREDSFSIMRQSTSDDSPDVWKGTIDGKGMSFTLRSMFMFVSIDPTVGAEADENRIFRVGLVKAKYSIDEWLQREKEITQAVTPEICDKIRAYTWDNLTTILKLAKNITPAIQLKTHLDNRTAYAEAILIAAHLAVFEDNLEPDAEYLEIFLSKFYGDGPIEKRMNENEEMVDRILDEVVQIDRDKYTLRDVLSAVGTGSIDENIISSSKFRREAGNHGVGICPDGNLAIAINHHRIMRIIDKPKGYHHQLARHPSFINKKGVGLGQDAKTKNCVIIGGVL